MDSDRGKNPFQILRGYNVEILTCWNKWCYNYVPDNMHHILSSPDAMRLYGPSPYKQLTCITTESLLPEEDVGDTCTGHIIHNEQAFATNFMLHTHLHYTSSVTDLWTGPLVSAFQTQIQVKSSFDVAVSMWVISFISPLDVAVSMWVISFAL
jgi:hypothetical protein